MIEFLKNFHFIRPWLLLWLLLPLIFYIKKIRFGTNTSSWENVCDENLLKFLLVKNGKQKRISLAKYFYTGIIIMTLAVAGPTWKKVEIPAFTVENPTLFVLSLAQDMQLKDVTPSRLERAKFMISDIIDSLDEGQTGLEVYSQEPYIITPLTDDAKIIKNLLPQIVPNIVPDNGDRLDRALKMAVERFQAAGYNSGNIVLFASDVGQRLDYALETIEKAVESNYNINVIDTSYSGNDKMQMLAEKGNGIYLHIKKGTPDKIIQKIKQQKQDKIQQSQNMRSDYLDYGYYLVFIVLICMLPFFRRGLLILILGFILYSPQAYAGFFKNNNQEGFALYKDGKYEQALAKFKDNLWRGISLYKLDKKEEALKEFAKDKNDIAFYNQGVVLTKMCKYQEALAAFDKALEINPNNKDAQYNKQVLNELFEKAKTEPDVLNCNENQQQNQQNNQNNNENKQDNQNQQQNNSDNQEKNQNDNQQSEQNQQEQKEDQQQQNQNNEQQDNQQQNNEQNQSDNKEDNQQQNSEQNQQQSSQDNQSSEQNNSENKEQQESPSDKKNDENGEKDNTPAKANQDEGDEQKSDNKKGDDNNATEEQEEERELPMVNAKEGDKDDKYDEEALAIQRRYREIPEDVGGLLRAFIKKEYLKDRYHDEKN